MTDMQCEADREEFECPLCHDLLFEPCVPPCGHPFCKSCLRSLLEHSSGPQQRSAGKCPVCRRVLHVTRADDLVVCRQLDLLLAKSFPEEYAQRRDAQMSFDEQPLPNRDPVFDKLPVFVLDSTLPRQHLHLNVFEPRYTTMVRRALECGSRCFGMAGASYASHGVVVRILSAAEQWDGRFHIEVVGDRSFKILSTSYAPEGFLEAEVEYLDLEAGDDAGDAALAAADLPALVDKWEAGVRDGGWQRLPNHLTMVREQLGPMPTSDQPGALATWIVALINPLPALGVAPEMRPALLAAESPMARVRVAEAGLLTSIAHLEAAEKSWRLKLWKSMPPTIRQFLPALMVAGVAAIASYGHSYFNNSEVLVSNATQLASHVVG